MRYGHFFFIGWATIHSLIVDLHAQQPVPELNDYEWHALVTVTGRNSNAQFIVPQWVYEKSRQPQLADVRLFNPQGQSVAFSFSQVYDESNTRNFTTPATIFPVYLNATNSNLTKDLNIRTNKEGTVIGIREATAKKLDKQKILESIVLDLGKHESPINGLKFTIASRPEPYRARLSIEVSDDLRYWDIVGDQELSWLTARQNSDSLTHLTQDVFAVARRSFRYARIRWLEGEPEVFIKVEAQREGLSERREIRYQWALSGQPGRQTGDWVFQSSKAIPVDRIALRFSEYGVVFPAAIGEYRTSLDRRADLNSPTWQFVPLVNATFYRLRRDASDVISGEVDVPLHHSSTWVVRNLAPTIERGVPQLVLSWRPVRMIFLINQPGTYTLAVGNSNTTLGASSLNQVAPGLGMKKLSDLEPGIVAAPTQNRAVASDQTTESLALEAAKKRKWLLWLILFFGVSGLSFLTYRIFRQMKDTASKQTND